MAKRDLLKGFVALGLLCVLGYIILKQFFVAFGGADASVKASIIAGLFAGLSLVATFWRDRAKARQEAHRESKIKVYSEFYDIIFHLMNRSKEDRLVGIEDDVEFQKIWMQMSRGLMFYGSPSVIRSFVEFKGNGGEGGWLAVMKKIGDVLLQMRADIGLGNQGLNNISIHQVYVRDDLAELAKLGDVK